MDFEIVYYKDNGKKPVEEFLADLKKINIVLWEKAVNGINKLKNKVYHREPLSKHIEPGLWELRIRVKTDILRILYTFNKGKIIVLLHVFVKKQQKTLSKELEMARKRLKEVKLREVN